MIRLKNYRQNTLVVLQKTRKITKDDLLHQEWKELKSEYLNVSDSLDKALASIINSILHQRRKSFIITRRSLKNLVMEDRNYKEKDTFSDRLYPAIIGAGTSGLFEVAEKREHKNSIQVYRLIDEYLLSCLDGVNMDHQVKQSIDYARKYDAKNNF